MTRLSSFLFFLPGSGPVIGVAPTIFHVFLREEFRHLWTEGGSWTRLYEEECPEIKILPKNKSYEKANRRDMEKILEMRKDQKSNQGRVYCVGKPPLQV